MENILEIKNLNKAYKNFKLNNINFDLKQGFIMGFIGENGAGKTTTIKLIMNLIKKDSGEIKIFDKDNIDFEKEIKSQIGFVYDDGFFYENLTIDENSKMIANFYKEWDWNTFNNYLKKFKLDKKQKVKHLSKGMKMKFSLALALSHNAKFIIMDEPTSGLDPVVRNEVLDILQDVIKDGDASILMSTHITSDLEKIADYITYIHKGKIIFSKSKEEIFDQYKIVKGSIDALNEDVENCFESLRKTNYSFEGLTKKADEINEYNQSFIIENPSLEDIMVFENQR